MVKRKNLALALVASGLLAASFAPISFWFAAPIAYAIYLTVLIKGSNPARDSFIFAFTANAIILSWSKTFVGVTPWILLAILQGLYLIPIGILARYVKNPIVLVAAIVVMDEFKNYFPFGGFGWTRIAFSQADSPFINLVSIFGVVALSLATLFLALLLIQRTRLHLSLVFFLIILALIPTHTLESKRAINVRAVQGGVPERGLAFNARAQEVLDNHIKVTLQEFSAKDELIIWPENAIDVDPMRNALVASKIESLQSKTQIPLLAGAILDGAKLQNAAILFDENGRDTSTYIKRYLTPFGEYIPLRGLASRISPHTERVTDFSPGEKFLTHSIKGVNVSTIICYEILSDQILRESAQSSAFIAVLTNSATFAGSAEGGQQLNITRIRAVEAGKNIISVSTTGPTAFINARGEVLKKLNDGEVGSLSWRMDTKNGQTLAVKYGGLFSLLVILFSVAMIAFALVRRRSSS